MKATSRLLEAAGLGLAEYKDGSRSYRLASQSFPGLSAKVFQEKDIPVQVSLGNYDLGICGSDWVTEILSKYPEMGLEKVIDLGYGQGNVYAVTCRDSGLSDINVLKLDGRTWRIVSEYPNLAEALALKLRLKRFKVFPLWGATEAYLPECADLALVNGGTDHISAQGLMPLCPVASTSACLIANRNSWESKDMEELLAALASVKVSIEDNGASASTVVRTIVPVPAKPSLVRLALPDGHQKKPTAELLTKAGFVIPGYTETTEPRIDLTGVMIKVIRPQDMPMQVANGNFDLAITGQDWLRDHLSCFPSSPVKEILKLGFGGVRIVAVVVEELPVNDLSELRHYMAKSGVPWLRVASEYTNLADKFARDNRLSPYRVVPTWGASEAFLPEDADLLVENTQTGQTLAQHKLKIIDTLMTSTACLIGSSQSPEEPEKAARIEAIINTLNLVLS